METDQQDSQAIDCERLTVGTSIAYKLLPIQNPVYPDREWRGRIIKLDIGNEYSLNVVWVESLDEGFEGYTEYVFLEQISRIDD